MSEIDRNAESSFAPPVLGVEPAGHEFPPPNSAPVFEEDLSLLREPEFNHEPGEPIELRPDVFVGASHGNFELPIPEDKGEVGYYELNPAFNTRRLIRNFSDHGTWGTEDNPGILRFMKPEHVLVEPPAPRLLGDPNRDSDSVKFQGDPDVPSGQENVKTTDFEDIHLFTEEGTPTPETLEYWRTAENGPEVYHRKLKERFREKLENTDGPVFFFDIHDTSEWMFESQDQKRLRKYPIKDGNGEIIEVRDGFPLAVVSDRDGTATSHEGFAERLGELLEEGFELVGVSQGKTISRMIENDNGDFDRVAEQKIWDEVLVNNPYKGAEVVRLLGIELREELTAEGRMDLASKINACQIEVNRTQYVDEETQEINGEAANIEAMVLAYAMNRIAEEAAAEYKRHWKEPAY